jgi:hypothetical protein
MKWYIIVPVPYKGLKSHVILSSSSYQGDKLFCDVTIKALSQKHFAKR